MRVRTPSPLYCPRCHVALMPESGDPEHDTPEICRHLTFHYFRGGLSEDVWYHVAPDFLDAYLKALADEEYYHDWIASNYDPEYAPKLQSVQPDLQAGMECWEAMKGIPFDESLAMSVCNEDSTILFYILWEAHEYTDQMYICVDCSIEDDD